ncbi:MAG: hypothetical protein A2252_08275 [Elusimicrobia bacterium RIFOXYA2_FULL_39_19]|nr:MAG: hypothetical protein A2252_08275 [Elusimicrobia bacterium RIFOXYA2_FULL_39_19]
MSETTALSSLKIEEVPQKLQIKNYFDLKKYPFEHEALFKREKVTSVIGILNEIEPYAKDWLKNKITSAQKSAYKPEASVISEGSYNVILENGAVFKPAAIIGFSGSKDTHTIYIRKGASVIGANIYLNQGDIYVGEGTVIEPGTAIKGPVILGKNNEIRQGAYFRGNIIIGNNCVIKGELKNVLMMNDCQFPHTCYVGDSVLGYCTHFGNQATSANFGIMGGIISKTITLKIDDKNYDLNRNKIGIIMGDYAQVGCNAVSDPGTFLLPYTIVYSLVRIPKGIYGPNVILKNKSFEKGITEVASLKI